MVHFSEPDAQLIHHALGPKNAGHANEPPDQISKLLIRSCNYLNPDHGSPRLADRMSLIGVPRD